jgi:hypothetical protein
MDPKDKDTGAATAKAPTAPAGDAKAKAARDKKLVTMEVTGRYGIVKVGSTIYVTEATAAHLEKERAAKRK